MESVYLILVIVLFALAISDLIVGVSNDAVNFLNSAIGSKAASFKVIMSVAALGVLFGAVFSDGMMEVARKGIFNPQYFKFSEIMIIFLAVMIADIILLDLFNTFGMPTSTTVSIVFELLGSAVAVSLIKINTDPNALGLAQYINTSTALKIITGILLSVIIAFTVGMIVQWISRLIFSFNYDKKIKYFGSVWGGFAIAAITFFIVIKGAKHAAFMTKDIKHYLMDNWFYVTAVSFVFWTILLQIISLIFKNFNILKVIVIIGTFGLAVAFSGNDLVNFIGVPLAGYESYKAYVANGHNENMLMEVMSGKIHTDAYMLLIAGLIMVITLWLSKKAKTVIKTSVDLARQEEGEEKFGSSLMARNIVRSTRKMAESLSLITPKPVKDFIDKQFDSSYWTRKVEKQENPPAFDMLRASVNLVVASILISYATSQKLPLSTTYVTFMVAMGTSLADRAWGKESAVYRITGVISVIAGWFFTAVIAFSFAFIIAYTIHLGGVFSIFALIALAAFFVVRTHYLHKKREELKAKQAINDDVKDETILEKCTSNVIDTLSNINDIYTNLVKGLDKNDRKLLREVKKDVKTLNQQAKYLKDNVYNTIRKLDKDSISTSHFYVQVLDYLRETAHCLEYMIKPSLDHVENDFNRLSDAQINELKQTAEKLKDFYNSIFNTINTKKYENLKEIIKLREKLISEIEQFRKEQIKRLKHGESSTKASMLYLGLLHETKNLLLHSVNLVKAQRDFDNFNKS